MSTKVKYWVAGVVTAAIGLVLARAVSPMLAAQVVQQLAVYFAGVALALAGLLIILYGVRKPK
jgi:hypothetical protein